MTITVRRLIVVVPIAAVLLLANFLVLAEWLDGIGVIGWARSLHAEYVTGTAITIVAALLVLVPAPTFVGARRVWNSSRRCRVCNERIRPEARYCAACGSRV